MDIQSRKIVFVQEFLKLQNEELIARLEKILRSDQTKKNKAFKPMSVSEFSKRIDKSMEDSKNGRLISSDELLSKVRKWG